MSQLLDLAIRPGIYTDETARGAEPYWRDGDHVRFRNGIPEKIGGWVKMVDDSGNSLQVAGFARRIHDWASLDGQTWSAIATNEKLYLMNGGLLYNITPLRASGQLTNPFSTTIGSADVSVSHYSHSAEPGDWVYFYNASAVGGITIDGGYKVKSITDIDNYVIEHSSAATATASGGVTVDYEYEIHVGYASRTRLFGYGIGPYGKGPYGTPRSSSSYYSEPRMWSLDNWGEDLIAAPKGGKVYVWERTAGPGVRAQEIENAPLYNNRVLVSPEDRHLLMFGSQNGNVGDAMLVRWSDQEDYNEWLPNEVNTAGDKRLDSGSEIITAIDTRGEKIIFTDEALYSMQFVGPPYTFAFSPLGQSVTIISPNAAVHVNGLVIFMGTDDFYVYEGVINVMPCPVRNHVFDDLNEVQKKKVYGVVNRLFTEVTWYYPSGASSENDRYVSYNYREQSWAIGTLDRCAMHDQSANFSQPYGVDPNGYIYLHEEGTDADGQPLPAYLESAAVEIGEGQYFAHVSRLIPDFLLLDGSIDVSIESRRYPHAPMQTHGPYTVDASTLKVSTRARARQVSLKIESNAVGDNWRMGTWRGEVRAHGTR